jgi:hypothetical protein
MRAAGGCEIIFLLHMIRTKKEIQKERDIFDERHYRAQAMLRSKKFKEMIAWLKGKFVEFDRSVPTEGFKTIQEYLDWNKRWWGKWAELRYGTEYKKAFYEITGGNDTFTLEQAARIREFEERFLPPVYGKYFDTILQEFNIDPDDKGYQDFLERHIFFNESDYPHDLLSIVWHRDTLKEPFKLYLEILPTTKLEDVVKYWDDVTNEQKLLPGFKKRNRAWENFERDIEIYMLYKDLKDKLSADGKQRKSSIRLDAAFDKGKPYQISRLDNEIYEKIREKHGEITFDAIRTAISRAKKHLGVVTDKEES